MEKLFTKYLDTGIRGKEQGTWNKHDVKYDKDLGRWYLKLGAFDVKEIRAKIWQCPSESDQ